MLLLSGTIVLFMVIVIFFLNWYCSPILKYMGDYPSKKQRLSTELTDQVFESPLQLVSLSYNKNFYIILQFTSLLTGSSP